MVMVCFALIIGAVSAKGNAPGNTGNSYPLFINLTEKDSSVVAQNGAWGWVLDGGFGKLLYKTGPKPTFVFNAARMVPDTGYALISYAEPWPGIGSTLLGTVRSDAGGNVSISGKKDVSKGFVCNKYPTATSSEYQVNGSKVWLVLASDLSQPPGAAVAVPGFETTQFTAWNDADYLFETDLVNKGCIAPELVCDTGYADCDGSYASGCEVNTNADPANCGSCGNGCSFANAGASCSGGTCAIGLCNADYGNCDSQDGNGCEIDLLMTTDSCGSCGNTCPAVANGVPSCSGGVCGFACDAGYADCDGDPANGCETNTGSDVSNCGLCGNTCMDSDDHGSPSCMEGMCGITCDSAWTLCDGAGSPLGEFGLITPIGVCVDLDTDTGNCGSCGNACAAVDNGVPSCSAGTCAIGSCNTDYGDCDGQYGNGCEIDVRITTDSCGFCGNTCDPVSNGVPSCSAGTCGIGSCDSWFDDCDNDISNGCEADLGTDTGNCGSCETMCTESDDHGSPSCTDGMCGITCDSPWTLCDGAGSPLGEFGLITPIGVCVDLDTDTGNCGSCGYVCDLPNTDYHACDAGVCVVDSCDEGWGHCDGNNGNGCEKDIYNDEDYCGDCDTQCDEFKYCDQGYCEWIS